MAEEIKALGDGSSPLEQFSILFDRSSDLRDVLSRLPGHLVLSSGLSAKRNGLIEKWDMLESPSLDGSISEGAIVRLQEWIHEAEVSIAHIIHLGNEERKAAFGKAFSGDQSPEFEVVSSVDELDFVSDEWCWPWAKTKTLKKKDKKGFGKEKLIKYGAFGALGVVAILAYLEDDV